MGFRKGRQYATTWLEKVENWNEYYGGSRKYTKIDCYLEALKRDPEYAEAWCGLGSEITKMDASEDTDKTLAGMDLFKDEPKITDNLDNLHRTQINAAVFCFNKAIEIKPKNVDAWYQKGLWYNSWLYHDEEKIACFLEVTKLDPSISEAWHNLANVYAKRMWDEDFGKALKCYDEAINNVANDKCVFVSPADLDSVFADKADLLSECVKKHERWYNGTDSDLKKKYSSGKDALMCYDKALEIRPKYGYASYKKGVLLERLSRYEEALECFENAKFSWGERTASNSNNLHRQALRDKLKPHEAGSKEAFETYCRVLGEFLGKKKIDKSEVEYARKKLNENILQHIHELPNGITEDDVYSMGQWLDETGREKEALELYDKAVEKSLENGRLSSACSYNNQKAVSDSNWTTKDKFDCYEKTIQLCEDAGDIHGSGAGEQLAEAYASNAHTFKTFGNMDKAIEYIDHAIKLEREYGAESMGNYWDVKVGWLPDEEAIKFIDEEIKAWQNSSYYDDSEDDKEYYIDGMKHRKNELLKKLAK